MRTVGIGVIGVGNRFKHVYGPLLTMLPGVRLAGVFGPDPDRTATAAGAFGARIYPDLDGLLGDPDVDALIACVRWSANPGLYLQLASWDRPLLLETPLAADPHQAPVVADALESRGAFTCVAEQYPQRPVELLKRELLDRGMFGDVRYAMVDGVGHEYHGISLLRGYLGEPAGARVLALQRDLPLADHITHRGVFFPGERVQHALIEFDNGAIAAYHWSWLNYESPIRTRRISGFSGTLGSVWGEEMVAFSSPEQRHPMVLRFDRRTRVVLGVEVPAEIAVLAGDTCITKWQNPHSDLPIDTELITAAAFVDNLASAVREPGIAPLYAVRGAAADHEIVLGMYQAIDGVESR